MPITGIVVSLYLVIMAGVFYCDDDDDDDINNIQS
jgi:hypothetical protein